MPGGDRTGPYGAGAMTGRGAGYCGGNDAPGWTTGAPGYGRGGGFGGGFGRGRGAGWTAMDAPGRGAAPAQPTLPAAAAGQEIAALQAQIRALQAQLERIGRRLDDLGPAAAGE